MFYPYSFFIGLRYTRAKRSNNFVSFISTISMLGIMLGVAVLIVVMSVMNGFEKEMRERILGSISHGRIQGIQPIEEWEKLIPDLLKSENIKQVSPLIQIQAMLSHNGKVAPSQISGIDPKYEKKLNKISQHMTYGDFDSLKPNEFGIILGEILALKLRARPGDTIAVVLPEATISPIGVMPRIKRVKVVGVFSLGAELDSLVALIHIQDAAKLKRYPKNAVESIRLQMDDLFKAAYTSYTTARKLGKNYIGYDWTSVYGNLFQSIRMEKRMVGLLLFLIIAVAAFNMVSTLVMTVTDKQSDIAILRTLGASRLEIIMVFMVQGCLIGVTGTIIGAVLGVLGALNISAIIGTIEKVFNITFLSADTYFISYFPSDLKTDDVLVITITSLILSFLATIYPSIRASKIKPAEALRYE